MSRSIIPIAVILILLIGLGAYIIGAKRQTPIVQMPTVTTNVTAAPSPTQALSPTVEQSPTAGRGTLQTAPMQVVDSFYSWYTNCLQQSGATCNYKQSAYVNVAELSKNIDAKFNRGNPIICGQNPPQSYTVDRTTPIQNNSTTTYVTEKFGSGTNLQILVGLKQETDGWKITNITCPRT